MKHLKTYEGIFDFLKKKKEVGKTASNVEENPAKNVSLKDQAQKQKEVQKEPEIPKKTPTELLKEECEKIKSEYSFIGEMIVDDSLPESSTIRIKVSDPTIKILSKIIPVKEAQVKFDVYFRREMPRFYNGRNEVELPYIMKQDYGIELYISVKYKDSDKYKDINLSIRDLYQWHHSMYDRGGVSIQAILNRISESIGPTLEKHCKDREHDIKMAAKEKKFKESINEDILSDLFIDFIDLSENNFNIVKEEHGSGYNCVFQIKGLDITPQRFSKHVSGNKRVSETVNHTFTEAKFPLNDKNAEVLGLLAAVRGRMKDLNDDVNVDVTMRSNSISFRAYIDYTQQSDNYRQYDDIDHDFYIDDLDI